MKVTPAALFVATFLPAVSGFAPSQRSHFPTSLASTTAQPPERVAPSAGWEPEWEGREGLAPEDFMKSDMTKPDLSGMWECPLTRWDSDG